DRSRAGGLPLFAQTGAAEVGVSPLPAGIHRRATQPTAAQASQRAGRDALLAGVVPAAGDPLLDSGEQFRADNGREAGQANDVALGLVAGRLDHSHAIDEVSMPARGPVAEDARPGVQLALEDLLHSLACPAPAHPGRRPAGEV